MAATQSRHKLTCVLVYCRTSSRITLDTHANASAFHGVSIVHERGLVTFSAVFNDISLIMRNASIEIVIYIYTVSQKTGHPTCVQIDNFVKY